jgi:hypothetical protein
MVAYAPLRDRCVSGARRSASGPHISRATAIQPRGRGLTSPVAPAPGAIQIEELLDDLESSFFESYEPEHERPAIASYAPYFLGSIVLNEKNGRTFIIDGQQRLTTLTLLLLYLRRSQKGRTDFDNLIFSELFGKQSFNLDVPERLGIMQALLSEQAFDPEAATDRSVANIWDRFADIVELFPETLSGPKLPFFTDWLLTRVILVEIVAHSDDDAYTIFETMNDRGLSLSATEMLKGYLLANITDDAVRTESNERWRSRVNALVDFAKEDELDFFKAWLRATEAESIRERKKGSTNQDFDKIGIGFHKWVRENSKAIGLVHSADFAKFADHDFEAYSRHYLTVRQASLAPVDGLESVHFNALANFTLQYPLMLAPVSPDDDGPTARAKMGRVAAFMEILIARRVFANRTLGYSAIVYTMFNLMKELRGRSLDSLRDFLRTRADELEEKVDSVLDFSMNQQNQWSVLLLLARMTDYVETESKLPSRFAQYVDRTQKARYDIEHIWPDIHSRYEDVFPSQGDFARYRNHFGGLLLLPETVSRGIQEDDYSKKRDAYEKQNLVAASLSPKAYAYNPGFNQFIERSGLPFHPYDGFGKAELDQRQALYRDLARVVWDPARLL